MGSQQSFSALEGDIQPRLRNDLNHAESLRDVHAAFVLAVRQLLLGALGDAVPFYDDDIALLPGANPAYRLTGAITGAEAFRAVQAASDLEAILARFAESASHRCQSMALQEDRDRARIHKDH